MRRAPKNLPHHPSWSWLGEGLDDKHYTDGTNILCHVDQSYDSNVELVDIECPCCGVAIIEHDAYPGACPLLWPYYRKNDILIQTGYLNPPEKPTRSKSRAAKRKGVDLESL